MLSSRMVCYACHHEIPPDAFRLYKTRYDPSDEDSIECPFCLTLNFVELAKGRGRTHP